MKGKAIIFAMVLSLFLPIISNAKEGMHDSTHIHVAEFTGYYADNSRMEGGYKDISGNWLDPSDYTVAAPSCIKLGSTITIGGTGNWRDGVSYTVTDRGGAIVVDEDGTYHIDILMDSREQADRFGRVRGYIIVKEEGDD